MIDLGYIWLMDYTSHCGIGMLGLGGGIWIDTHYALLFAIGNTSLEDMFYVI